MTETIEEFRQRWLKKFEEIKLQEFERYQCFNLATLFLDECMLFKAYKDKGSSKLIPEFNELKTDLDIALEISYSNFRKNHKSWWMFLSTKMSFFKDGSLFKIK